MKKSAAAGKIAGLALLAIFFVVLVHLATASAIQNRGARKTYEDLKSLAPGKSFGTLKTVPDAFPVLGYYPVLGRPGEPEACVVVAEGKGYNGPLPLFIHIGANGEILGVRLFETREYPGMGKEAEEISYMKKFIGTGADKTVPARADGLSRKDAAAVSGATVTFTGIAKTLEAAAAFVKNGGTRK